MTTANGHGLHHPLCRRIELRPALILGIVSLPELVNVLVRRVRDELNNVGELPAGDATSSHVP
jgi:hypothetical protein